MFVCALEKETTARSVYPQGPILTLGEDGKSGSLILESKHQPSDLADAKMAKDDLAAILYTSGTTPAGVSNPITTGYFYKHVGYTVWGNQLRYHQNYPPVVASDTVMVRNNVTSPKPFALLFLSSSSTLTNNLNLRVSLEAYDLYYGARLFQNGTTTIQAVIPSRTQPPPLTTN